MLPIMFLMPIPVAAPS